MCSADGTVLLKPLNDEGEPLKYSVLINSKLRAGFEPTSKDLGAIKPGNVIEAL